MSAKSVPTDLPIHAFASAAEFEAFLDREHLTLPGFYLKHAKKASGIESVSTVEAVEVALCFGWINGQGKSFDKDWYLARYTPRRAKSIWSQINVNTVAKLMEQGRMRPAGTAAVDSARADGRWERAYSAPSTITVPDDFAAALANEDAARAFFEGLNRSDRYSVLWRLETASLNVRTKRIKALVEMLAAGEVKRVGPVPSTARSKSSSSVQKASTKKSGIRKPKPVKAAHTKYGEEREQSSQAAQPRRAGLRPRP